MPHIPMDVPYSQEAINLLFRLRMRQTIAWSPENEPDKWIEYWWPLPGVFRRRADAEILELIEGAELLLADGVRENPRTGSLERGMWAVPHSYEVWREDPDDVP